MERVYTNYWASGHQVVLMDVPAKFSAITVENVRVIINETQKKVLASSMKKANISSVVYSAANRTVVITLDSSTASITNGDKLTVKIDMGDDLRDAAGSCIIEDIIDQGLPAEKASGFCGILDDGDFIVGEDVTPSSQHSGDYKVGDIIKPTAYDATAGDLAVAKTVSSTATDLKYNPEYNTVSGVTAYILWKANHYYRVTGIHDVYDLSGSEVVMQIFTYEELEPANITDLIKQAEEKLAANAGNLVMATDAEYASFKSHMQTQIANILTPITESNNE
jgi:hypothetical protein